MAGVDKRLTDLTELSNPTDNAWIHIVEPSDISQHPDGSSYKVKKVNFGGLSDAPSDGDTYGRKDGGWVTVSSEVLTTNTNITSANLSTQDVAGFVAYINGLVSSFAVAANEIRTYTVTDTGQKFEILLRGRSFGGSEPDILTTDVLEIERPISVMDGLNSQWFSVQSRLDAAGVSNLNTVFSFIASGTNALFTRTGADLYNSLGLQNYAGTTAAGSNVGLKNNTANECYIREGGDYRFFFANNDTNSAHVTAIGTYSLASAIPNLDIFSFTGDFVGVGNDGGDTNLSFYAHRVTAVGQVASSTKVPTSSSFPAHTTTDAYILKYEFPRTETDANRFIKLTLTNIITGAEISHTFPFSQTPVLNRPLFSTINRSNRNSGIIPNLRFGKWTLTKK